MKRSGISVSVLVLLVLLGSSLAVYAADKDLVMKADSIKWEDGPIKGTHVAKLWGDWTKGGEYGVLVRFDAGLMNSMHMHTQTLRIYVIKGTFVHQSEGGVEEKAGPGSYVMQVGGGHHISGCAAGADCEFFMMSEDKFDMTPIPPKGRGMRSEGWRPGHPSLPPSLS